MSDIILEGRLCRLRPYHANDARALREIADDFLVAQWLTRAFPHPYTETDAEQWIALATTAKRNEAFAIEANGVFVGGCGFNPHEEEEHRGTAEFGYWLGKVYWGRGIGTDAARTLSDYLLSEGGLHRLEAHVFAPNRASMKVLENAAFQQEGILRSRCVERNGALCDCVVFGRLRGQA